MNRTLTGDVDSDVDEKQLRLGKVFGTQNASGL